MLNVGGGELLIILLVALVVLGPTRLPGVARQMGQAAGSLKAMAAGFQAELEAASKPVPDKTMHLSGPTDQAEAIAATQPTTPDEPPALLAAARRSNYDDRDDVAKSLGGPTDLSNPVMGAQPPPDETTLDIAGQDDRAEDDAGAHSSAEEEE